jgi:hypothetical protein
VKVGVFMERSTSPKTAVTRIRASYLEMPGLRLTFEQAQRLCGVEGTLCQIALDALVATHFLRLGPNGLYARVTDGAEHSYGAAAK